MLLRAFTVKKKQRILDVFQPDEASMRYFEELPEALPQSIEQLRFYMKGTICKFKCGDGLRNMEYWDRFVTACHDEGSEGSLSCETLSDALCHFASFPCMNTDNSEQSMIGLDDAALLVFNLYAQKMRDRNVSHTSTSGKLPDYNLTVSNAQMIRGEEKLKSNYKVGAYGHDPKVENVQKTPWGRWRQFYGTSPYVLSFMCVGSANEQLFTMGALVHSTRSFEELFTIDIAKSFNRPAFAVELLKLLPVVKGILRCARDVSLPLPGSLTRVHESLGIVKVMSWVVVEQRPVVVIEWKFRSEPNLLLMLHRLQAVFDLIKEHPTLNCLRLFGAHGIHEVENDLAIKGSFVPYGQLLMLNTAKEVLLCVGAVARTLAQLHAVGVVHNDIRWDNIVQYQADEVEADDVEEVKYIIIDFDDAFTLTEGSDLCPALDHLSIEDHSEQSRLEAHGCEVDVWSLGHLLLSKSLTNRHGAVSRVANHIKANFTSLSADDVVALLERLLLEL